MSFRSCSPPSDRDDLDRLDHVAHVAGGLPQCFHRLALARAIPRAHAQVVGGAIGHEAERELAERITPELRTELRFAPRLTAVGGVRDLADALPAVERDAAHG